MRDPRSGQSIIEMIIAISMLTVAFLGIATLLSQSFFLNRTATDQTIASYLAAEGIEVTKSIIDHDVYSGNAWGTCCAKGNYTLTGSSTSLTAIGGSLSQNPLLFDPNSESYQYTKGSPTDYKRTIKITVSNSSEIDVQSIVQWSSGPIAPQQVIAEDHFYDWQP